MGHLYFCVFVGLLLYREGDLVKGFSFSLEHGGGSFEGVCFFRVGGGGGAARGSNLYSFSTSSDTRE